METAERYGMVYIPENDQTKFLKIGCTKNPKDYRCRQISNGDYWKGTSTIKKVFYFKNYRDAEKQAHEKLSKHSVGHELFSVSIEEAANCIKNMGGLDEESYQHILLKRIKMLMERPCNNPVADGGI